VCKWPSPSWLIAVKPPPRTLTFYQSGPPIERTRPRRARTYFSNTGADNLAVFDLMNVDDLDVDLAVLRWEIHERFFLRAGHSGVNNHLVPILKDVLDR
jgi:hypothetical protein